jgi:hypothetical protein
MSATTVLAFRQTWRLTGEYSRLCIRRTRKTRRRRYELGPIGTYNFGIYYHLGLGLHIARNIVLEHNGNITVSSVEGEGTHFEIRLPIVRPTTDDEGPPAPFTSPVVDLRGPRLQSGRYPAGRGGAYWSG